MVYDYMKKQLQAVPADLYRRRYPAIADLDRYYASDNGIPPEGNLIAGNICVGGQWTQVHWHADPKLVEMRDNYIGPDPGFIAPEKLDFRLKPDSPVWRLGFQAIPVEKIGLQDDKHRRELKRAGDFPVR
jgi:hypothetical protein